MSKTKTRDNINPSAGEDAIPFPTDLFEKAQIVHERMMEMKEDLDKSVFVGSSKDEVFQIALHGDGRPEWVSLNMDLPPEEKLFFEKEIFEALDAVYECHTRQIEQGLEDIQREVGVGPGLELPF